LLPDSRYYVYNSTYLKHLSHLIWIWTCEFNTQQRKTGGHTQN